MTAPTSVAARPDSAPPADHARAATPTTTAEPVQATAGVVGQAPTTRRAAVVTVADLAAECGVSNNVMDSALRKWAKRNPDCREGLEHPKPREPKFVYRRAEVQPVIARYQRAGGTDERTAEKKPPRLPLDISISSTDGRTAQRRLTTHL